MWRLASISCDLPRSSCTTSCKSVVSSCICSRLAMVVIGRYWSESICDCRYVSLDRLSLQSQQTERYYINELKKMMLCFWSLRSLSDLKYIYAKEFKIKMSSYGYKNMCTVNELLFTKKISQGSQEPHRRKYFSPQTSPCLIIVITAWACIRLSSKN